MAESSKLSIATVLSWTWSPAVMSDLIPCSLGEALHNCRPALNSFCKDILFTWPPGHHLTFLTLQWYSRLYSPAPAWGQSEADRLRTSSHPGIFPGYFWCFGICHSKPHLIPAIASQQSLFLLSLTARKFVLSAHLRFIRHFLLPNLFMHKCSQVTWTRDLLGSSFLFSKLI